MKPILLLGLGNPSMGDDGAGWHVADRLAADPRLPADVEVQWGGTDLLGCFEWFEGRQRVLIVDACLGRGEPGTVSVCGIAELTDAASGSHRIPIGSALALLPLAMAGAPPRIEVIAIEVSDVRAGAQLSAALTAKLPDIVEGVLSQVLALPEKRNERNGPD